MNEPKRIGLMAGGGDYPVYLAKALKAAGCKVYCQGIKNHACPELAEICDSFVTVGLGRLRSAIRYFQRNGITEATMAGRINKRLLFEPWFVLRHWPDLWTVMNFAPLLLFRKKDCNNDTLLTAVVDAFARFGIRFMPGTDFAPELIVKRQKLTRRGPTAAQWKDICYGWSIAREIGRMDIGQSVAVKNMTVLAIEAVEGTDDCIRRAGSLCPSAGFIVAKIAKPNQDMRFDVPTFGLLTLQAMAKAGAAVLAMEADKSILIDRQEVIDFANQHNIAIVSITEEDTAGEQSPFTENSPVE